MDATGRALSGLRWGECLADEAGVDSASGDMGRFLSMIDTFRISSTGVVSRGSSGTIRRLRVTWGLW